MKRGTNILAYVIFALFIMLFAYCENEVVEPDTLVVADDPDSTSFDYFIWYDTNMNNAIFGGGQSAYYFVNNPGIVDENKNYVIGDTTVTISMQYLDFDSGQFYQLDTFPGNVSKINGTIDVYCSDIGSQLKEANWRVRFPTSKCRINGSTVSNSPIVVKGNQVSVLGESFSVNEPSEYGPPSLASVLAQSINNPPSPPTSAQIDALPCEEIVGSYLSSREIHVFIEKNKAWTTNSNSYVWTRIYSFGFSHYWYYDCPDGPLERGMFCSVRTSDKFWMNGTLTSNTSVEAFYHHTY